MTYHHKPKLATHSAMFSSSVPGLEQLFQKAGFVLQPMEHALSWRITVEELARSPLLRSAQGEVRQDLTQVLLLEEIGRRRNTRG